MSHFPFCMNYSNLTIRFPIKVNKTISLSIHFSQVSTYKEDFREEKRASEKLRHQKSMLQSHLNACKDKIESQSKKVII